MSGRGCGFDCALLDHNQPQAVASDHATKMVLIVACMIRDISRTEVAKNRSRKASK